MNQYIKNQLSVIIPVYNSEKHLQRCLNSICNQTFSNLQIIVINDGSTDSSFSICQQIAKKDNRIFLINQPNKGVSYSRNVGLKKATGEYVTFVDSDDFLEKNAYEIALSSIGNSDCLAFGYIEYYEKEKHKKVITPDVSGLVNSNTAIYECLLFLGYNVTVWNKIFRTEKIENIKFNPEIFVSEDELWLISVLLKMNSIMLLNTPLYYYVQTSNSLMRSPDTSTRKIKTSIIAKESILDLLKNDKINHELFRAKIYDDLYSYKWKLYICNNKEFFNEICSVLKKYKLSFIKSKHYGINRKIKYYLMDFLIFIKSSDEIINKLASFTTYKKRNHLD